MFVWTLNRYVFNVFKSCLPNRNDMCVVQRIQKLTLREKNYIWLSSVKKNIDKYSYENHDCGSPCEIYFVLFSFLWRLIGITVWLKNNKLHTFVDWSRYWNTYLIQYRVIMFHRFEIKFKMRTKILNCTNEVSLTIYYLYLLLISLFIGIIFDIFWRLKQTGTMSNQC